MFNSRGLTSIEIPSSVTSIGLWAFSGCSSLTSVTFAEGSKITRIGSRAFEGCSSLTSIEIPSSVTSIDYYTFSGCRGLTNVYYNGTIEDWCNITFGDAESNPMYYASNFYIIDEELGTIDYNGKKYSLVTEIEIPNTITSIGKSQFYGFNNVTSITIPNSVTSIGYGAFYECSILTNVYYAGTSSDWSNIYIDSANSSLINATKYYYSESEPTEAGNYWHYDEEGDIKIW